MERTLAESSGVALREANGHLYFVDFDAASTPTIVFVCSLLALVFGVNGLVLSGWGLLNHAEGMAPVLTGLAGMVLSGLIIWGAVRLRRELAGKRLLPRSALRTLLLIDPAGNAVLDGNGRVVAKLDELRLTLRFQVTSSARCLVAQWPQGEQVLVRGNPFAGGVDAICLALKKRGFRVE